MSTCLLNSVCAIFLIVCGAGGEPLGGRSSLDPRRPPTLTRCGTGGPTSASAARAYMRSTYDRQGGNHTADASHFLYQEADDFNVTLDVAGAGVLYFARYNHWHGRPVALRSGWQGSHRSGKRVRRIREKPAPESVFLPERLFPNPLTWTWSITKGADLMWVPIPFEAVVPNGLLPHLLRDRLLHLPPVRKGSEPVTAHPELGWPDSTGSGSCRIRQASWIRHCPSRGLRRRAGTKG